MTATNYSTAAALLETGAGSTETRALAYATLANADAVAELTAVLAELRFPTLDLHKAGGGRFDPQYRIEPVKR